MVRWGVGGARNGERRARARSAHAPLFLEGGNAPELGRVLGVPREVVPPPERSTAAAGGLGSSPRRGTGLRMQAMVLLAAMACLVLDFLLGAMVVREVERASTTRE